MNTRFGWHARFAFVSLMCAICFSPPMHTNAASPTSVRLIVGESYPLSIGLSDYTTIQTSDNTVVQVESAPEEMHGVPARIFPNQTGEANVDAKLFGIIPWKSIHVTVEPRQMVYVGGQSIGVSLHVAGAMVVGRQPGCVRTPLHTGDIIYAVNGRVVHSSIELRTLLEQSTSNVQLTIHRGQEHLQVRVPVQLERGHSRLGVYVRDKTAGIGTLTFYDPVRHTYGALGHVITDPDTGQAIDGWGNIYNSDVTGIVKSQPGHPGEKRGRFSAGVARIGDIEQNTPFGLFGRMDNTPKNLYAPHQYTVALPEQVHTGKAQILTVLHGDRVQAFNIEIENVVRQKTPNPKSLIVHVTDPALVRATGGIVQGMSGSPILQDGRLVGAVTHVFMSDATRGYGVFAEWMVNTAQSGNQRPVVSVSDVGNLLAV